jgi:hypothetical protein
MTPSHARSKVQEAGLAKRVGGVVVKGSGSGDERGDVRLKGVVRIEAKTTAAASFSVTVDIIRKLNNAVAGTKEIPILEVEILSGAMKLIVMPSWALDIILDTIKP